MKRLSLVAALLLALASPSWAAFPSVSARSTSSESAGAVTSHDVVLPSGIADGGFVELTINFETGSDPGLTVPAGWFRRINASNGGTPEHWMVTLFRVTNGTEGTALTLTTSTSCESVHSALYIADAIGWGTFANIDANGVDVNWAAHTPQGGAKDYLWTPSYIVSDTGCSSGAAPSGYSNWNFSRGVAIGEVGTIERQLNATSADPGALGCTPTGLTDTRALTWAIYPQLSDAPKFARWPDGTGDTADGTNHTCPIPTGIAAGMLLVPVIDCDGTPTITFTGYTHLKTLDNGSRLAAYYRQADGAEDTAAEFTTGASEQCSCRVYTLRGHENPATQPPEVSTGATGTSTAPDPDSISPTGGAKNYFVIAAIGTDDSTTATTEPSTYFQFSASSSSGGSGHVSAMTAINQVNASSIDPGAATIGASRAWQAFTIVVHPDGVDPGTATGRRIIMSLLDWFLTPRAYAAESRMGVE